MKKSIIGLLSLFVLYSCGNSPASEKKAGDQKAGITGNLVPDTTWTDKVVKTKDEWKKILTPEQFHLAKRRERKGLIPANTMRIRKRASTTV